MDALILHDYSYDIISQSWTYVGKLLFMHSSSNTT